MNVVWKLRLRVLSREKVKWRKSVLYVSLGTSGTSRPLTFFFTFVSDPMRRCPLCQDYMYSIARSVDPKWLEQSRVRLVVISNGSWKMIKAYKSNFLLTPSFAPLLTYLQEFSIFHSLSIQIPHWHCTRHLA